LHRALTTAYFSRMMTPLRWTRDALNLSQEDAASVLGASEQTVRAVEKGRLKFSLKFASRLSALTGLDVAWLMQREVAGDSNPPPHAAAEVRKIFSERQEHGTGFVPGGELSENIGRALLFRSYIFQSLILTELGYAAAHHGGFFDEIQNANVKLLRRISNRRTRARILQQSRDLIDGGIEEVLKYVTKEFQNLQNIAGAVRQSTKQTYPKTNSRG
jgi:DNA-binding XRE family transcriptional regulator